MQLIHNNTSSVQHAPSPWCFPEKIRILLWQICWTFFCVWTPKPFNRWRLLWLSAFGAKIYGVPFVHQRARIQIPWNLTLFDGACIGDRTNIYSLGRVEIHEGATVAQEAYLCTGTHLFADPALPLIIARIIVQRKAFIGARAFILPGVLIGQQSIVGACSMVTKDVKEFTIVAGNPAREIKKDSLESIK